MGSTILDFGTVSAVFGPKECRRQASGGSQFALTLSAAGQVAQALDVGLRVFRSRRKISEEILECPAHLVEDRQTFLLGLRMQTATRKPDQFIEWIVSAGPEMPGNHRGREFR